MAATTKLSDAMLRVLINLAEGREAGCHLHGQAEHGGFNSTANALVKRGLMTWSNEITKQGLAALKAWRQQVAKEVRELDIEGQGTGIDCDGRVMRR